jgi:TrmH family RNA methyltransferase
MASWKQYLKLKFKKYRQEWKLFLVEGKRLCQEAIDSDWTVESAMISEAFQKDPAFPAIEKLLTVRNIPLQVLSTSNFTKLSDTESPQGIVLVMKIPPSIEPLKKSWRKHPIILILDGIRDPGNLGTIIRTADWYGVHYIATSSDSADFFNSKTIRASMGSLFRVSCQEFSNLPDLVNKLKENRFKILATSPIAPKLMEEIRVSFPLAILLGGEAEGISPSLLELSTEIIQVKKYGQAESLNVAVASGILLNHFTALRFK